MSDKPSKIEQVKDFFRKPYDDALNDAKKTGRLFHILGELNAAKGIMAETLEFGMDEKHPIDDRLEKMNKMLVLVNSLPHAKPENAAWDEAYTGIRGLMQFWKMFKSQREFYDDESMADAKESVEKDLKESTNAVAKLIFPAFHEMVFTKEFAEWCVTSFGDVAMLETIFLLLNFAYNEFNVPANTILMLSGIMQGKPETPGAPTA